MHASSASNTAGIVVGIIFGAGIYWLPSIIALCRRRTADKRAVVLINTFLGWTIWAWIIALLMAFRSRAPKPPATYPGYLPPGYYPPPGKPRP